MEARKFTESDLKAFGNAAAGHDGLLVDPSGLLIFKPCTAAEIEFYESCRSQHPDFLEHMPTYMGTIQKATAEQKQSLLSQDPLSISAALQAQEATAEATVTAEQERVGGEQPKADRSHASATFGHALDTSQYIVLENMTGGFRKPNVLDVKLGARLWADDAPLEKRARLDKVSDESTSRSKGFRVAGMRVWSPEKNDFTVYDKMYGRGLSKETVSDAFVKFFRMQGDLTLTAQERRQLIVQRCTQDVADMLEVLERQESRMYSASILFVYEGDADALEEALEAETELLKKAAAREDSDGDVDDDDDDDDDDGKNEPRVCKAKMIDFAHARWTPGEGPDENMLHGVRNIFKLLEAEQE